MLPATASPFWQRRFWEHTIRDEADLNHHRDYLPYNPLKHGLVSIVSAWPWSSFHRYVRWGIMRVIGEKRLERS
ncbi:MAG TPA: hypothetical protein VLA49_01170 [Anaerolineales bacterium]|nr:hypothetical protein [Anaerolineales bacterium]